MSQAASGKNLNKILDPNVQGHVGCAVEALCAERTTVFIVGIETTPQYQPAECSFLGHGTSSCSKFLRVTAPSTDLLDTLLISEHAFVEMAKVMGYVPADEKLRLLEEIKGEASDLAPTLSRLVVDLDDLKSRHDSLQTVVSSIQQLHDAIEAVVREPKPVVEPTLSKKPTGASVPANSTKPTE